MLSRKFRDPDSSPCPAVKTTLMVGSISCSFLFLQLTTLSQSQAQACSRPLTSGENGQTANPAAITLYIWTSRSGIKGCRKRWKPWSRITVSLGTSAFVLGFKMFIDMFLRRRDFGELAHPFFGSTRPGKTLDRALGKEGILNYRS